MKRIPGCAPWAAVGLGFAGVSIDSEPGECALPSRLSRLVALLLADVAVTFCASAEHLLRVVVAGVCDGGQCRVVLRSVPVVSQDAARRRS